MKKNNLELRILNIGEKKTEMHPLCSQSYILNPISGQSLVELLVAVGIGVIAILGVVFVLSPSLKTSTDISRSQTSSALAKQLLDGVRTLAESNWHSIDTLSLGANNRYYLIATGSPFLVQNGVEFVQLATTTYTRSFYITSALRDPSYKIITSGGVNDPSTRLLTVVVSTTPAVVRSMSMYLTRSRDRAFDQTDWSGGSGFFGPVTATSVTNQFGGSSNINGSSTPGSIIINGF